MLDIKFLRENPDVVKKNIENKFQNEKLPLVDEVIELDQKKRDAQQEADSLRANRNKISKEIGDENVLIKIGDVECRKQLSASSARKALVEQ